MKAGFNKHRYRNFFIGISISCGLTLFAFNYKTDYNIGEIVEVMPESDYNEIKVISVQFPKPEPEQEVKPKTRKVEPFKIEAKIKIVSNKILTPAPIAPPAPIAISIPTPVINTTPPLDIVHDWVDVKPEFPGGTAALNAFLRDNIIYPEDCEEIDQQGMVKVLFIVDEFGNITGIKVIGNELLPSAARESLRVIGMMPRWTPGVKDGKNVTTYFIQPIRFRLF